MKRLLPMLLSVLVLAGCGMEKMLPEVEEVFPTVEEVLPVLEEALSGGTEAAEVHESENVETVESPAEEQSTGNVSAPVPAEEQPTGNASASVPAEEQPTGNVSALVPAEEPSTGNVSAPVPAEEPSTGNAAGTVLSEDGSYDSRDDVALYLVTYRHLPDNYITKSEARALGWNGGGLEKYAPGKCIGGDTFGNREGVLPKGHTYTECDIDTLGASSRGAKRIVFSEDFSVYYTGNHYESFETLYVGGTKP